MPWYYLDLSVPFYFQIIGMPYLSDTLKPVLDKIFEERKYCELDPSKTAERRKSSTFRWVNIWGEEFGARDSFVLRFEWWHKRLPCNFLAGKATEPLTGIIIKQEAILTFTQASKLMTVQKSIELLTEWLKLFLKLLLLQFITSED